MPNDPANDRYNPPSVRDSWNQFDEHKFADVEVDEILWPNTNADSNYNTACRKINETQIMNTRTREVFTLQPHDKVYIKG